MRQGPGETLDLIRSGTACTRGELLDATGLSRLTVSSRIDQLVETGIIREAGRSGATGGRRAATFIFDPDVVVLAAALDATGGEAAVVDPHGRVLVRCKLDTNVEEGPEATLDKVKVGLRHVLAESGIDQTKATAVALSVPGPVDPEAQRLYNPPIMPGWDGWPVVETIRDDFGIPTYLENDADAMAFGEMSGSGTSMTLMLVKVSAFIGGGLVIGGKIFRGADGGGGDIGHVNVGGSRLCRCGREGCLATVASGRAILRELMPEQIDVNDVTSIVQLVEHGDREAIRLLQQAGNNIGQVLSTVVGILNPNAFVIGGTLANHHLVAAIRSAVYADSLPRATRNLKITQSRLGPDAALVGVTRVAIEDLYSAASVNSRLGTDL